MTCKKNKSCQYYVFLAKNNVIIVAVNSMKNMLINHGFVQSKTLIDLLGAKIKLLNHMI